jgi:predicted nucleic acid-binding Zn finger protein
MNKLFSYPILPTENSFVSEKRVETREDRAQKVVNNFGVKLHRFEPSRREIWTVVGTEGDALVDYDRSGKRRQYCSCDDFHFRVLGGRVSECYHLMAARNAREQNHYSMVIFSDEEYSSFLRSLLTDIFSRIS